MVESIDALFPNDINLVQNIGRNVKVGQIVVKVIVSQILKHGQII